MRYQDLADELQNNHASFTSFCWHDRPDDAERWTIVYLGAGRDAGPREESNHHAVREALTEADPDQTDWREERHNHWAVGYVDGFAIRVGTPAFAAYAKCHYALADYPILDESDWSQREHDLTEECWDQYGRDDLRKALGSSAPDEYLDCLWRVINDGKGLSEIEGNGVYFRVDQAVSEYYFKAGMCRKALRDYQACRK